MTRILVTGATGYVGSALLELLRERGDEGVALLRDRSRAFLLPEDTPSCTFEEAEAAEPFDAVVHLGYGIGLGASSTLDINRKTIDALMRITAAHRARFVHASSLAVFGYSPSAGTDFTAPLKRPRRDDTYAYVKGKLEQHVMRAAETVYVPCKIVRIGNVMGPASLWARIVAGGVSRQDRFLVPGAVSNATSLLNLTEFLREKATEGALSGEIELSTELADVTWQRWAHAVIPEALRDRLAPRTALVSGAKRPGLIGAGRQGLEHLVANYPMVKRWASFVPEAVLRRMKRSISVPVVGGETAASRRLSPEIKAVMAASKPAPVAGRRVYSFEETAALIAAWAAWANYFAEYDCGPE